MRPFVMSTRLHARLCGMLAALLMFAQGAVVIHQSNIEKHGVKHHCEICILDAELHGANIQAAVAVIATTTTVRPATLGYRFVVDAVLRGYSARAPPIV